jgi:hypothetical protein
MSKKVDAPFYPGCSVEVRTDDKKSYMSDSVLLILSTRIPNRVVREEGQDIIDAIVESLAKVVAKRATPKEIQVDLESWEAEGGAG